VLSPADLARLSPNVGPGDHAAGQNALSHGLTQGPIPARRGGYATAVPDLYLVGAASWPGPGCQRCLGPRGGLAAVGPPTRAVTYGARIDRWYVGAATGRGGPASPP